MKSKIITAITVIFLLGLGGYFFLNSNMMEGRSGKPVAQSHRSYEMEVLSETARIEPGKPVNIVYKIKNDNDETLKKFDTVHEKIMHFIVVRKDLQYFQHLHPEFNTSTGEFTIQVNFPTDGPFRIFPDFTPGDDNPQKLPVTVFSDINVGDLSQYKAQSVTPDTQTTKTYGDYEITFTVPKVKAQKEFTYGLTIEKNDTPVNDLEIYLGALGHSVIIKEGTLDFIHTHALENNQSKHGQVQQHGSTGNASKGPEIRFSTMLPEYGLYKQFTQFQHQGNVITADYVMNVNK